MFGVNFRGFYTVTDSNFLSLSVDCLCLEFGGLSLGVGQNSLLALLPISRLLLAFYCAYCWYLSELGFQKEIFLFC